MFTQSLITPSLLRTFIMAACAFVFVMGLPSVASAFSVGDTVEVAEELVQIRISPETSVRGNQTQGALGVVVGTGPDVDGVQWVEIDFEEGVDGWLGTQLLTVVASAGGTSDDNASGTTDSASSENTASTETDTTTTVIEDRVVETITPVTGSALAIGDRVRVVANVLNVRPTPAGDPVRGTQAVGSEGVIVGAPTVAGSDVWVNINYDSGVDGWSATQFLTEIEITTTGDQVSDPATDAETDTDTSAPVTLESLRALIADLQSQLAELLSLRDGTATVDETTEDEEDEATEEDTSVAAAETDTLRIYRDGELANTLQNKTRKEARVRCRTLSQNIRTQGYRCTWGEEEVFSRGEVVVRLNGRQELKESGRSRLTAFQQCRLIVETNKGERVTCEWENQTLLDTSNAGNDESNAKLVAGLQEAQQRETQQRQSASDETIVYKNGNLFARRSGLDKDGAVALCAQLAAQSPEQGFRCTFDGNQVAIHGHLKINLGNNRVTQSQMAQLGFKQNGLDDEVYFSQGMSKAQAINLCARVWSLNGALNATLRRTIGCYWNNTDRPGTNSDYIANGYATKDGRMLDTGFFIDTSPGN